MIGYMELHALNELNDLAMYELENLEVVIERAYKDGDIALLGYDCSRVRNVLIVQRSLIKGYLEMLESGDA